MLITSDCIKVETAVEFAIILDIKIHQQINQHATAMVSGILQGDTPLDTLLEMNFNTPIQIKQMGYSQEEIIFYGIVANIDFSHTAMGDFLKLEAMSLSAKLDIEKKTRSFQNKDMPYKELFEQIIKNEYAGQIFDTVSNDKILESAVLQYEETDWQFLLRMCSRLNTIISSNLKRDKLELYIGVAQKQVYENANGNYTILKQIDKYFYHNENYEQRNHLDFVSYRLESPYLYELCDKISFRDVHFVITKIDSEMKNGILVSQYTLVSPDAVRQNKIYNENLTGLAIEAKVIDVKENKLKLHLSIDESQDADKAYWYEFNTQYAAAGNTGWYCMPQIDDSVMIYFPKNEESNAVVKAVNRLDGDSNSKTQDPSIKYFGTDKGKELKMSSNELQFYATDGKMLIHMSDENGIIIKSDKDTNIISDEDINLSSEKLSVTASDSIVLSAANSSIKIDKKIVFKSSGGVKI